MNSETISPKAILLTVGSSPEPLAFSIEQLHPERVVFICSQDTVDKVTEIKESVKSKLQDNNELPKYTYSNPINDPSDLVECYRIIQEELIKLREDGFSQDEIRIDYTGGTKTMAAAAVLAAAPDGYRFIYISGNERSKDGTGTVISGTEIVVDPRNPWIMLEENTIRDILRSVQLGQWKTARELVNGLKNRADQSSKSLYKYLELTICGLDKWDHFCHEDALKDWNDGTKTIGQAVKMLSELSKSLNFPLLIDFAKNCQSLTKNLIEITNLTETSKAQNWLKQHPDPIILDLVTNAIRQARRGEYDQATLRLYRSIELCAARRLKILYGIHNSNVAAEQVPESLIESFERQYGKQDSNWKIGLRSSCELLAKLNDPLGQDLFAHLLDGKLDIASRNENWLIHGERHSTETQFNSFLSNVKIALNISDNDVDRYCWPEFFK